MAIIATTIPISKRYAKIFANIYPKNNEMIIRIPSETGEETNQHSLITIKNMTNAKIIVNMPTIVHSTFGMYYCL